MALKQTQALSIIEVAWCGVLPFLIGLDGPGTAWAGSYNALIEAGLPLGGATYGLHWTHSVLIEAGLPIGLAILWTGTRLPGIGERRRHQGISLLLGGLLLALQLLHWIAPLGLPPGIQGLPWAVALNVPFISIMCKETIVSTKLS